MSTYSIVEARRALGISRRQLIEALTELKAESKKRHIRQVKKMPSQGRFIALYAYRSLWAITFEWQRGELRMYHEDTANFQPVTFNFDEWVKDNDLLQWYVLVEGEE